MATRLIGIGVVIGSGPRIFEDRASDWFSRLASEYSLEDGGRDDDAFSKPDVPNIAGPNAPRTGRLTTERLTIARR